jgi:DNA/RNA-binding domain of Phe-tRNA-synthetase-like protein
MTPITISANLKEKFPKLRLGCITCRVHVMPSDKRILALSENIFAKVCDELDIGDISLKPAIRETKEAYRILGKDPSRYRPSAEALTRRIVKGKDLFWINNIVDILNLISLESGFSIGGYDANQIQGAVEFGVGRADEAYQAIGRGEFNIENLPLFRDQLGAFGSPTSDSLRTMVGDQTERFLMIICDFQKNKALSGVLARSVDLYSKFAQVTALETKIIKAL